MSAPVLTAPATRPVAPPTQRVPTAPVIRLWWRLIRRGTAFLWLAVAAYMATEVLSYASEYPDQASRQRLLELTDITAVRMLQGVPGAVDTTGGFAVWDGGWMLSLIVACWGIFVATRLTRGEEDCGRIELVLSRPLTPRRSLMAAFVALTAAAVGVGVAAAVPFILAGEPTAGAILWGSGMAAFTAVFAALGALAAQLVEPRRRAVSTALGAMAALFLLRVVANSADDRLWLLALTPFGWLDRLSAFTEDRWLQLPVPAVAAVAVAALAVVMAGRRDTGAAVLRARSERRARLGLLGGSAAFGWRLTFGALVGWTVTVAVSGGVFGLMTGALIDFIKEDQTYRNMLEEMGMDMSVPVIGFLSYLAMFASLSFAAFVAWRIGAMRQEEAEGRLENLLVRGVPRARWLVATIALALVAALVLVVVTGLSLWGGAVLADSGVVGSDLVEPMAGTLPLIALFLGLTVLVFAIAPRLTVVLPVTFAVVSFLLDTFGAMLGWPHAVLALSPFHHLARLPGQPMTVTAIVVMTAVGVAAAAAGVVLFGRRDLQGA